MVSEKQLNSLDVRVLRDKKGFKSGAKVKVVFYGSQLFSGNYSMRFSVVMNKAKKVSRDKHGNPIMNKFDKYIKIKKSYRQMLSNACKRLFQKTHEKYEKVDLVDLSVKEVTYWNDFSVNPMWILACGLNKGRVQDTDNLSKMYIDLLQGSIIEKDTPDIVKTVFTYQVPKLQPYMKINRATLTLLLYDDFKKFLDACAKTVHYIETFNYDALSELGIVLDYRLTPKGNRIITENRKNMEILYGEYSKDTLWNFGNKEE